MIGLNHQPLPDASREDDIKFNLAYSLSADKAGPPASGRHLTFENQINNR